MEHAQPRGFCSMMMAPLVKNSRNVVRLAPDYLNATCARLVMGERTLKLRKYE